MPSRCVVDNVDDVMVMMTMTGLSAAADLYFPNCSIIQTHKSKLIILPPHPSWQ